LEFIYSKDQWFQITINVGNFIIIMKVRLRLTMYRFRTGGITHEYVKVVLSCGAEDAAHVRYTVPIDIF